MVRVKGTLRLFCDVCYHEIKRDEDSYIGKVQNKYVQVCKRCAK